jgi:hypothetical protein
MPKFNVKGPDGKSYNVEGPDARGAVAAVQKMLGSVGGQPVGDGSAAVGANLIDGVPIIGPYLTAGADRLVAGMRAAHLGGEKAQSYEDELKHVQDWRKGTNEANPKAATAGYVGGQILGSAAAAAPFAGALAGASRGAQMVAGGLGGALGTGADTAVRTDTVTDANGVEQPATMTDRMSAALPAAALGGVLGGAAPVVASGLSRGAQRIADFVARGRALKGTGVSPGKRRASSSALPAAPTARSAALASRHIQRGRSRRHARRRRRQHATDA